MAPVVPHPQRIKEFRDARAFETWLAAHHDREPELWIKIHKKGSGAPSVTASEAVEVALLVTNILATTAVVIVTVLHR